MTNTTIFTTVRRLLDATGQFDHTHATDRMASAYVDGILRITVNEWHNHLRLTADHMTSVGWVSVEQPIIYTVHTRSLGDLIRDVNRICDTILLKEKTDTLNRLLSEAAWRHDDWQIVRGRDGLPHAQHDDHDITLAMAGNREAILLYDDQPPINLGLIDEPAIENTLDDLMGDGIQAGQTRPPHAN